MSSEKELNPKQQRFVEEYLVDLHGTKAATRAGYSEKSAHVTASRLLNDVKIAAAIQEAIEARAERMEITADRVIEELARIGFSDLRALFSPGGNLLRPEEWPDDAARAVSSVEVVTKNIGDGEVEHVHKLKTWDKRAALADLCKYFGLFKEIHEHTGKDGGPIETVDRTEREAALDRLAAVTGRAEEDAETVH